MWDLTLNLGDRRLIEFLALTNQWDSRTVLILHRVMKVYDLPGECPSGFNHRHGMALLGDVGPARLPIIEVPGLEFHQVTNLPTRVQSLEQEMDSAVAEGDDDDTNNLGLQNEDSPETELSLT
jgi:hypothetical protein